MEYVTLMGAEDVRSAGSTIASAAQQMQNAANSLSETLIAHQRFLDDWLYRFEEAIKKQHCCDNCKELND